MCPGSHWLNSRAQIAHGPSPRDGKAHWPVARPTVPRPQRSAPAQVATTPDGAPTPRPAPTEPSVPGTRRGRRRVGSVHSRPLDGRLAGCRRRDVARHGWGYPPRHPCWVYQRPPPLTPHRQWGAAAVSCLPANTLVRPGLCICVFSRLVPRRGLRRPGRGGPRFESRQMGAASDPVTRGPR